MKKLALKPTDILIAVMGVTGVGKSTFIQPFTQQTVTVGQSLESCTSEVEIYKCSTLAVPEFYLIDTPGFDDTKRSDTQILRELANWLTMAYSSDIKLTGIIYLHRIIDVRLGGAAMKNLRMFKKLCGDEGLGAVVLATTFWGEVDQATAVRREEQLRTRADFWGGLVAKGSEIFRQNNGENSAEKIISYLVSRRQKVVLEIQREMCDRGKSLDQTAAGTEVQAELVKARAEYERQLADMRKDMKEALAQKDAEWQQELRAAKEEMEERIRKDEEDREKLRISQDQLRREREEEREEERRAWQEEKLRTARQIDQHTHDIELIRLNSRNDIAIMELNHKLEMEKERVAAYRKKEEESGCVVM